MFEEVAARTVDGVTLRIDRVRAAGERRAVLVCLHAMMTDGRYFGARRDTGFAAYLARSGVEMWISDFRGHGRSTPPVAGPDDWSFDDLVELDLPAIVARVTELSGCVPGELAICGHSLGGLVATATLGTNRIPAPRLVLAPSTSVWLLGRDGPWRRRAILWSYRASARVLGRAPIRALRVGTADESRTYVEQLTTWAASARWTSLRGLDYSAALGAIATRVLPLAAADDWMCTPGDARAFAERIPTAEPVHVVDARDHFAMFTRPDMQPLWDWFVAQLC
jgi:alpha-beta hydrolase superfamily lysophospholipase